MYAEVLNTIEYAHSVLKISPNVKEYLKTRGISKETILEFKLGFIPINCPVNIQRFSNRLIFPITDPYGRYVGWTARTITNMEPKYLNTQDAAIFKKGRLLYNYDRAKPIIQQKGWVVLVEGQFDALRLYQEGIKNVVASSSTAFKPAMARLISRYADRVYVAYDGDNAGITSAEKVTALLTNMGVNTINVKLPDKEDPDSYVLSHGINAFKQLMKMPVNNEFEIQKALGLIKPLFL